MILKRTHHQLFIHTQKNYKGKKNFSPKDSWNIQNLKTITYNNNLGIVGNQYH